MDAQKKKFTEHIKSLIPISDLAPKYQNEVVQHAEILKFKKRQQVFKQGDVDAYTFYLLDGELQGMWYGGFQPPGVTPPNSGWEWVTGEPWDYTNWAPGEPNDA